MQFAVILMLCGLQKEQLLPGQQLLVKEINNKLDGDAAAVKLAEVQTERGEVIGEKRNNYEFKLTLHCLSKVRSLY